MEDKASREEFGSTNSDSRLSKRGGLGHLSSSSFDRIMKILVERHYEGNLETADIRLKGFGRAFIYAYCQAVLFPELCIDAYSDALGSFYLGEQAFIKLKRVDKDKGLAASFKSVMESCKH